ncbi:MAG: NUDIX domain-containing protein [Methylophilaceae bacterium]
MADDLDLTEHCISSTTLAKGGMLTVKHDEISLANGNTSYREYVVHPGAVLIVPLLPNGNLVLERQFRYPLHQVFIELPAGKIDPNEDILLTGQRELLEETGYTASSWVNLGLQHPCIGYSNEIIYMYLATGLTAGKHCRDEDELLEVFEVPFEECLSMAQRGEITDSKTITALFLAEKHLAKLHD